MASTSVVPRLDPGTRVRVTQRIVGRDEVWETRVEGEVLSHRAEPTGSWFARGKDDHLWLNRIRLKKDDGEITTIVVNGGTVIEVLAGDEGRECRMPKSE